LGTQSCHYSFACAFFFVCDFFLCVCFFVCVCAHRVVITVSPVRHWREGAVENMRSKACLLVAAQALCERYVLKYIYIYTYICIFFIHTHIHIHIHVYIHRALISIHIHIHIHVYIHRAPKRFMYFPSYEIMMDDLRDYRSLFHLY